MREHIDTALVCIFSVNMFGISEAFFYGDIMGCILNAFWSNWCLY